MNTKMKKFSVTVIAVSVVLFVSQARASLQSVLDGITTAPTAGTSSINVATAALADGTDSTWAIDGSGGSVNTIVIELAGFAPNNKFGVYDPTNPAATVQVFAGSAGQGDQALLSIKADGSVFLNLVDTGVDFAGNSFGYYLDTTVDQPTAGLFYSNTGLNADGFDHLKAVQGNGTDTIQVPTLAPGTFSTDEYILGWEDLQGGGDQDYDDFVAIVESVHPVPEAATIVVWSGLGLIGLVLKRRRCSKLA